MKDIKTKQLICISFLVILSACHLVGCDGWSGSDSSDDAGVADSILPSATTEEAALVASHSARLNATVNPNGAATTCYFEYGPTTEYCSTTTGVDVGSGVDDILVSANIDSLAAFTTYHFRIVAENSQGVTYGADLTFITDEVSEVPEAPDATTLAATLVTSDSARLNAIINPNGAATTCYFEYGTTTDYDSMTSPVDLGSDSDDVSIFSDVDSLTPNTTHHFRVVAANSQGISHGEDVAFTTFGPPTATTLGSSAVTPDSARLNGIVNPNGAVTTCYFEYGSTTDYGLATTAVNVGSGADDVSVNADIDLIMSGNVYHFRMVATNSAGISYGEDLTFRTLVLGAPTATSSAASAVTSDSARLNGVVNPNSIATTCYFEYGPTAEYGWITPAIDVGSSIMDIAVFEDIDLLTPITIYHFRLVGINSEGISYGEDLTFRTLAPGAPTAKTLAVSLVTMDSARLNGIVNPNGNTTTYFFEYGATTDYGSMTPAVNIGSGVDDVSIFADIGSLTTNTIYHFRLVAFNEGDLAYGDDRNFGIDFRFYGSSISAGDTHTLAIKLDGTLWAWGGDWNDRDGNTPVQIGNKTDWYSIAAEGSHSLAIKVDGSLWAWAINSYVPVQIGIDKDWQSVAAGGSHSLAIKVDGTLWAWGNNGFGQLGDGTTEDRSTPVRIGYQTDWSSVAAGTDHSLAIKENGTLWAWGRNDYGQLGDGTTEDRSTPVRIGYQTNWSSVVTGRFQSLGLKTNGSLWVWGDKVYYEPEQLGVDTDWAFLATHGDSYSHSKSAAIKLDGTLWELHNLRNMPEQVGIDSDWASVSVGGYYRQSSGLGGFYEIGGLFIGAFKTNGTLWTWGNNDFGQLGDGTNTSRDMPGQLGIDTDWSYVTVEMMQE